MSKIVTSKRKPKVGDLVRFYYDDSIEHGIITDIDSPNLDNCQYLNCDTLCLDSNNDATVEFVMSSVEVKRALFRPLAEKAGKKS